MPNGRGASENRVGLVLPLSIGFAVGCLVGVVWTDPQGNPALPAAPAFALSMGLAGFALMQRNHPTATVIALSLCSTCAGWGWCTMQLAQQARQRAALRDAAPLLVEVEGTVRSRPIVPAPQVDQLGVFLRHEDSLRFDIDASGMRTAGGVVELKGIVRVTCPLDSVVPRPGEGVVVRGWMHTAEPASNPGGFPQLAWARDAGIVAFINAQDGLVNPAAVRGGITSSLAAWREAVAARLRAALDGSCPEPARALAMGMVLGQVEPAAAVTARQMHATGLVHLLAISGFNLAVLGAVCECVLRFTRAPPSLRAGVLAAVCVLFAVSIDAGVSAMRAAACGLAGALLAARGSAWHGSTALSLTSIGLLIWAPWTAANAGFQLTFAAVIALHVGTEPLVARLRLMRGASVLPPWLLELVAVSVLAWMVSTPIVLAHFGTVSLWGAPLSVVLSPLAAIVVVAGSSAAALPESVATISGQACGWAAWGIAEVCALGGRLPGAALWLGRDALWLGALGCVAALALRRLCRVALGRAVLAGLILPMPLTLTAQAADDLEVIVLDVGNGSAIVVRSQHCAVLFDCGSSSSRSIGSTTVSSALRELGISRLEAMLISHPDLDHFSGVPEVMRSVRVGTLLVTERFLTESRQAPGGAESIALRSAAEIGVPVQVVGAGCIRDWCGVRWRWLHPEGEHFAVANEESMVIRIEPPQSVGAVLLTGDCSQDGLDHVLRRAGDSLGGIAVLELPHHGSFTPASRQLVGRTPNALVFQSTASARLRPDRWAHELPLTRRSVTARDGAIRLVLSADRWRRSSWTGSGWREFQQDPEVEVEHVAHRTVATINQLHAPRPGRQVSHDRQLGVG